MTAEDVVLEQDGQDDHVRGGRLAQAGADLAGSAGDLVDVDRAPVERDLADEPLAEREAPGRHALRRRRPVAGDQAELGLLVVGPLEQEHRAVQGADERRHLGHDQAGETVSRLRWPCSRPLVRARFDFSQSCSAFLLVVSRRLAIIWLMLSLSSATSPAASTVI